MNQWLDSKIEKHLKSINKNYKSIQKRIQIEGKETEINPINLSKKPQKKRKRKRNTNKIRVSLAKLNEKISIMDKIFPKGEFTSNFSTTKNPEPLLERSKTLKVLSFETKDGVFVRGKIIEPDNLKDIKKKFYPLGYGDMIKLNKKKIDGFGINNISDIKEKDPYKWGRGDLLLNQDRMIAMKKYTRKINIIALARKESNQLNIHFQKDNSLVQNESGGKNSDESNCKVIKGFGPTFKKKKQMKRDKKTIELPLNFLSINDYITN